MLGAGVGWDARVMWNSPTGMKRRFGRTGIAMVGLRELARYEFPRLVLTGIDDRGEAVTLRGSSVILPQVKRWAGGNTGIPNADPSDEYIDAAVIDSQSRLQLAAFWILMAIPGGRPLKLPGVRTVRLSRARVESEGDIEVEVHINGEPVSHTPLVMEPGGVVKVLVP